MTDQMLKKFVTLKTVK